MMIEQGLYISQVYTFQHLPHFVGTSDSEAHRLMSITLSGVINQLRNIGVPYDNIESLNHDDHIALYYVTTARTYVADYRKYYKQTLDETFKRQVVINVVDSPHDIPDRSSDLFGQLKYLTGYSLIGLVNRVKKEGYSPQDMIKMINDDRIRHIQYVDIYFVTSLNFFVAELYQSIFEDHDIL